MPAQELTEESVEEVLWSDACLAARVFGAFLRDGRFAQARLVVKSHAGPVRERWMAYLKSLVPDGVAIVSIPSHVTLDRLLGGLDISQTLLQGKKVHVQGLLARADQQVAHMPAANLAEASTISALAAAMDGGDVRVERDGVSASMPARFALLCFDESEPEDEGLSPVLKDRIMLHVDLRAVSIRTAHVGEGDAPEFAQEPSITDETRAELCALAASFGLHSMRPAMQMVSLAQAIANLAGKAKVTRDDVAIAVRLGLVHRARQMPPPPAEEEPPQEAQPPQDNKTEPEPPETDTSSDDQEVSTEMPDDLVLDAADASLPPGLLAYLKAAQDPQTARSAGGRRGSKALGASRGRPLTSRKGGLSTGKRLDVIATLRAAAPWQKLRRQQGRNGPARVHVRKGDLHIRRYQERTQTSTLFVVDASGSTALNRLGEAKGAIEMLLAESYARRDHVALISFRGREAQVLLPPTRALARAKRSLAALPGGGPTPMASGLSLALVMAQEELKKGREPTLVVLTDGSANVTLAGTGGRPQAGEDACALAKQIGQAGLSSILVDISRRPQDRARRLAADMAATYVPMPFASARNLAAAVKAHR
ncbi:MAG: magnesium chelatase subunit D [Pseudomonadota bacterium]